MKKSKRLLSILLALTLILGSISIGVSAAHAPYLDDDLLGNYNSIDQVTLTKEQQASLVLDKLDRLLADADIVVDLSVIGELNLRSIDQALSSIYDVTGNFLFSSATVGDLAILKTHRGDIANARRTSAGSSDVAVLNSIITYLGHCAGSISKIIDGSMKWGLVMGFLPGEARMVINDIPGFLKETLWDVIHPTVKEPIPANLTLDMIVQYLFDNQLGGKNAEALGFDGLLPGFDLNLETATGYRAIEEVAFRALNEFLVPLINGGLKDVIASAITSNTEDGGQLGTLVNKDYVVTKVPGFDPAKGIAEQFNGILGHFVNEMLVDGQTIFTWRMTANSGETNAQLLEKNIMGLIRVLIPLGGDTIDTSKMTSEELAIYIARAAVEEFVKHVTIPDDASLREIAVIGMKEFIATIVPEKYDDLAVEDTNAAILDCAKVIGTFYFNNLIDLDYHPAAADDTFDNFLAALMTWAMDYADGIVAVPKDGITSANVWDKLSTVLFSILDKRWFNYEEMFRDGAGTADDLTAQSLVQYVLDTLLNVNFGDLYAFFDHNAASSLSTDTARVTIIKLLSKIVNGVAPDTVPANLTTFESILNPATLKGIVQKLLEGLSAKQANLMPTVLNLLTAITGFADEQSLGGAGMSLANRVNCTSGSVPAGTNLRISNLGSGLNRAWRDAAGVLHQDDMYQLELVSLTSSNPAITVGSVAGQIIDANGFIDAAISGTVAAATQVRFDLTYKTILETKANGTKVYLSDTPAVASAYTHLFNVAGNYEASTGESGEAHTTKSYGFSTYFYTTNVSELTNFSNTLEHYYKTTGGHNDGQNIVKSNIQAKSGTTIPASIKANAPASGVLYEMDGVTSSVENSYATVNPYVVNIGSGEAQPYGVYEMQLNYDIKGRASGSTASTGWQDHTVVIYNDYGLADLLNSLSGVNRQRGDYVAAADAEWSAYQAILLQAYELVNGNPDHVKMFTAVGTYGNVYEKMAEDVNAAVEALDAKRTTTNAAAIAELKALLQAQGDPAEGFFDYVNYELFTFRRWQSWQQSAWGMVENQESATPSFIRASDISYAKYMLELLYPRMIEKAADKTALNAAIAEYGAEVEADYEPEGWPYYAQAKAFAEAVQADAAANQAKVNAARVDLMKAHRNLDMKALLNPAPGSTTVIDNSRMFIYGIETEQFDLESYITPAGSYTINYDLHDAIFVGTGANVYVMDGSVEKANFTVVLFGDLNGDGEINADDRALMDGQVAGTPFFTAADLNSDGVVDATDMAIMDAHLAGTYVIDQTGNSSLPTA